MNKLIKLAAICTLLIFGCTKTYNMATTSMEPTIRKGQAMTIINNTEITRDDIVAFNAPEDDNIWIFRVVGIPGDTIRVIDGILQVNSEKDPYGFSTSDTNNSEDDAMEIFGASEQDDWTANNLGPIVVPADSEQYFLMGDNRSNSYDSRYFGFIKKEDIIGTVELKE
ncbi:signal peptidase I [Albibacterium profundi]|uniref:Signal peptidase I n=1 Tax=Albibacterium profundi TaxID=3134906 RepID=A0ABV5CC69_9SPHI